MTCQTPEVLDAAQGLCGATDSDYARAISQLFPQGTAWPARRLQPSVQYSVVEAIAKNYRLFNDFLCDTFAELNPCKSNTLLAAWEKEYGLPDACTQYYGSAPDSIEDRRSAVCAAIAAQGGQTATYVEQVLAALGFTVTVPKKTLFTAGHSAGNNLFTGGGDGQYVIDSSSSIRSIFRAGHSTGNFLSHINYLAACQIQKINPAHLTPIII